MCNRVRGASRTRGKERRRNIGRCNCGPDSASFPAAMLYHFLYIPRSPSTVHSFSFSLLLSLFRPLRYSASLPICKVKRDRRGEVVFTYLSFFFFLSLSSIDLRRRVYSISFSFLFPCPCFFCCNSFAFLYSFIFFPFPFPFIAMFFFGFFNEEMLASRTEIVSSLFYRRSRFLSARTVSYSAIRCFTIGP